MGQHFLNFFEKQNNILFYFYSLGGMELTGASSSDCAHRGLAVNAPDWGLAHRFLVGTAVQGTEIFQVQFDVASSTCTCYYGPWLSLVLWALSCADLDRLRDDRVMVYTQRAQWR